MEELNEKTGLLSRLIGYSSRIIEYYTQLQHPYWMGLQGPLQKNAAAIRIQNSGFYGHIEHLYRHRW